MSLLFETKYSHCQATKQKVKTMTLMMYKSSAHLKANINVKISNINCVTVLVFVHACLPMFFCIKVQLNVILILKFIRYPKTAIFGVCS